MEFLLVIAVVVGAAIFGQVAYSRRRERSDLALLSEFAAEVRASAPGGLTGAHLIGVWERRRVSIEFGHGRTRGRYVVRLGVEVDPRFNLRIRLPSLFGRLQRALGARSFVTTGRRELDGRFLVASENQRGARSVFVHGGRELLGSLSELLEGQYTDEIVAEDGWLYLDCRIDHPDPRYFRWLLKRLCALAKAYERRAVKLKAVARPRWAWTGGGKTAQCPFCRSEIEGDELDLVTCRDCDTLHHGECFSEHGRCSIYGCGGERAERLRDAPDGRSSAAAALAEAPARPAPAPPATPTPASAPPPPAPDSPAPAPSPGPSRPLRIRAVPRPSAPVPPLDPATLEAELVRPVAPEGEAEEPGGLDTRTPPEPVPAELADDLTESDEDAVEEAAPPRPERTRERA